MRQKEKSVEEAGKFKCGVSWIFIRYFTGRKRVDNEKKKREIRDCGE